jgi:spore maturation protein CgeB
MDAHNMRTIEVAACGAFLLTEHTKEQAELLFKQGVNIECFADIDELVNKIEFYLTNTAARDTIIENALQKAQEYSIEKLLLAVFKNFV